LKRCESSRWSGGARVRALYRPKARGNKESEDWEIDLAAAFLERGNRRRRGEEDEDEAADTWDRAVSDAGAREGSACELGRRPRLLGQRPARWARPEKQNAGAGKKKEAGRRWRAEVTGCGPKIERRTFPFLFLFQFFKDIFQEILKSNLNLI
jgi:hypothetical protein